MLPRLRLLNLPIYPRFSPGERAAVQLLPEHRQLFGQRFWQLRGLKGMIDPHPPVTVDEQLLPQQRHQPKVAFNCRCLISNMAIKPDQIWVFSALAEVPTKVLTRSDCFKSLKKSSIFQRCWYTSATVAAARDRKS